MKFIPKFVLGSGFIVISVQRHTITEKINNILLSINVKFSWGDTAVYAVLFYIVSYLLYRQYSPYRIAYFIVVNAAFLFAAVLTLLIRIFFIKNSVVLNNISENIIHTLFSVFPLLLVFFIDYLRKPKV